MNWLTDVEYDVTYRCQDPKCNNKMVIRRKGTQEEWRADLPDCAACGKAMEYYGFEAADYDNKRGLRVEVDHNGVKGYKIGNTVYSKRKIDWMEEGVIRPSYTPEKERELLQSGQFEMLESKTVAQLDADAKYSRKEKEKGVKMMREAIIKTEEMKNEN